MKMTQKQKNALAKDLRALADKLENRMIVRDSKVETNFIEGQKEKLILEGWRDMERQETYRKITPDIMRYDLSITFEPQETEPKKKKKKKKKEDSQ